MLNANGLVRVGLLSWVGFRSLLEWVLDMWVGHVRLSLGRLAENVVRVVWMEMVSWMRFQVGSGVVNATRVVRVGLVSGVALHGLLEGGRSDGWDNEFLTVWPNGR